MTFTSSLPPGSLDLYAIEAARSRIADAIAVSPCVRSRTLSALLDCDLYLKQETVHVTGSFKERGARNRLLLLTTEERARGVITASAGNHAQGVAFHASLLGVGATIVMPVTTPLVKVTATRGFGAEVILSGENYDAAAEHAQQLCQQRNLTYVHPFDDDAVIAGQGTIGLELLDQVRDLDAVVVPVGGGGLLAGVALAIKNVNPRVLIYAVETAAVPRLTRALEVGAPVTVDARKTIADGIAARRIAQRTLDVAMRYVDGVACVDDEEIAAAILLLMEREKTVAEGAGAAALAAIMCKRFELSGKRVIAIVSGGNIDVNMISRIIDRGLSKTGRLMRVRVIISDVPGTLASLLAVIAAQKANVLRVHHDRITSPAPIGQTIVDLLLEVRGPDHIAEVERAIGDTGLKLA